MLRRAFLGSFAGLFARAADQAYVSSDTGNLRRVLVHPPGAETRKGLGIGYGPPRFMGGDLPERISEEHLALVQALRAGGAEVLTIRGVLAEALAAARAAGQLAGWLRGWAPQLAPLAPSLTADGLLGAADELLYRNDPEGNFSPLADPIASFYWTRDSAVMTPKGVVICQFANAGRTPEALIMRFAYEWSPALRRYPVVFDASEEQVSLEGGDLMVLDAKTLLCGTGNRTEETAARRLARRLAMDVLAVSMPALPAGKRWSDPGARTPLHSTFLHLDTVCTFAGKRTAVTLPWLFEKEWAGRDPLTHMLRGLARSPRANRDELERMAAVLKDFGTVRRFRAGTGEPDSTLGEVKLADYLKREGYRVVYVGGAPPAEGRERHMAEHVLSELRRQAANVVATGEGKVLAYAGNPRTQAALEQAGIAVTVFPGLALMGANGGPHCLTQPLERE